jgi:cardiolipin synthase
MWRHSQIHLRKLARRMAGHDGSPDHAARGLAAGFFAAAFPLPGLQIPLSLFCAWLVNGNKLVAVVPQFLSNAGTMLPLAYFQFWLGSKFWPGSVMSAHDALGAVQAGMKAWNWALPVESFRHVLATLLNLGLDVAGPLGIGVLLSAIGLAIASYPLGLVALTHLHLRRLRRRMSKGLGLRALPPLHLPLETAQAIASITPSELMRYAVRHALYVRADSVTLLIDGRQAFPAMLRCIDEAKVSVELETYILCADHTGRRFAAALMAAARRGVKTRVLYDGVGGMNLPAEYVRELLAAGVRVAVFRPLSKLWNTGLSVMNRRDHRKILVVDSVIGFTGGLNIGDDYASKQDGGAGWRDTHARLEGRAAVAPLQSLILEIWRKADEHKLTPEQKNGAPVTLSPTIQQANHAPVAPLPVTSRNALVQIVSNKEFLNRVRLRRAYIHAIRNARRYVLIENAYFIPDRGIRRALYRAVKRGVKVAVVVAQSSDVAIAAMASRALYSELLHGGVRLYEYPVSMLHSKAAVVDDVWSIVSSYNLDHRSLLHSLEAGALLLDPPFAVALREQIMRDIGLSVEVRRQVHDARPWRQSLAEALAYQLRYWL